jgi:hypothetical protein
LEREPGADVDDLEEVDGPEFLYYGFVRFILFAIVNPLDLAGCYYQCRYTPLSGAATSFWRRGSHAPSPAIQSSPTVKPSPAQVPLPVDADGYLPESAALALPLPMDSRGADHADRPLSPFKDANAAAAALASSLPQSIFGNLQVAWRQEGFLALFKGKLFFSFFFFCWLLFHYDVRMSNAHDVLLKQFDLASLLKQACLWVGYEILCGRCCSPRLRRRFARCLTWLILVFPRRIRTSPCPTLESPRSPMLSVLFFWHHGTLFAQGILSNYSANI